MGLLSCYLLGCEYALFFSFVGQHGSSHDIADTQDSWDVCFEMVVDDDSSSLVKFDSGFVAVEVVSVGSSASGYKDVIALEDLTISSFDGLNGDLGRISKILAGEDLVGGQDLDSLFGEDLMERFSQFFIHGRADLIHKLNNCNIAAESLID